jgi:hypothetical protein
MDTKKYKRVALVCCLIIIIVFIAIWCTQKKQTKDVVYDNYSYGLDENGYYINLSNYPLTLQDFSNLTLTYDEVLNWGLDYMQSSTDVDVETVDDYVYLYAKEFLSFINLANKDIAEDGDIVSASLEFYIDGKLLDGYVSTNSYAVSCDGDSIISSFIGHKANDSYEVEYTFPDNDAEYPSKTATVKVVINAVIMSDPIEAGVIEDNLDKLKEYFDGEEVYDRDSFFKSLRIKLAESTLEMFIEDYIQKMENIDVPSEFVEYELYRLKFRLQQLGYDYEEYLSATSMTHEDVVDSCEIAAKENYISMIICDQMEDKFDDQEILEYYGDTYDDIAAIQGEPYMKLKLIRLKAISEIAKKVNFVDE